MTDAITDIALGYVAAGTALCIFLHCFYDWVAGLTARQKLGAVASTILLWPLVLGAVFYFAFGFGRGGDA